MQEKKRSFPLASFPPVFLINSCLNFLISPIRPVKGPGLEFFQVENECFGHGASFECGSALSRASN